ncbi:MAG: hypothetical protein AAFP19_06275 [Bacteroidota bacterium]
MFTIIREGGWALVGIILILGACRSAGGGAERGGERRMDQERRILLDTIFIEYQSELNRLIVDQRQLSHWRYRQVAGLDSPVAAPDAVVEQQVHMERVLTGEQLLVLKQAIQSGFWELNEQHGAPEGYRAHMTFIKVQLNSQLKTVRYRSSPSFEEMPAAFRLLETVLLDLSQTLEASSSK